MSNSTTLRATTLSELVFAPSSRVARILAILGASVLTGLAAQWEVRLPFSPVPITGQTLAVVALGAALGSRAGALAMLVYLAEGAMGLPVFAGGASGPAVLLGPTAGYLFGFVPAAFLAGWLAERGWDRSLWRATVALLIGSLPIFALGLAWLSRFVPAPTLIAQGLTPFIAGDIVKSFVGAGVLSGLWKLNGGRGPLFPR